MLRCCFRENELNLPIPGGGGPEKNNPHSCVQDKLQFKWSMLLCKMKVLSAQGYGARKDCQHVRFQTYSPRQVIARTAHGTWGLNRPRQLIFLRSAASGASVAAAAETARTEPAAHAADAAVAEVGSPVRPANQEPQPSTLRVSARVR